MKYMISNTPCPNCCQKLWIPYVDYDGQSIVNEQFNIALIDGVVYDDDLHDEFDICVTCGTVVS